MKKIILNIVVATLCFFFEVSAQQANTIKGQVLIGPDNKPLIGATIKIKNTKVVTVTDQGGHFTISISDNEGTLLISYTGYKTAELSFRKSDPNPLMIFLEEDKGNLDEVVVIGYGQTTKKLNTGSISSISAKEIEQQPVTNMLSALSGRMPGVLVQTTSGLPGGNISIQIRGQGSIAAGTDPLYIVDGVPYDGNSINKGSSLAGTTVLGMISPLNNLNPADIESITVLKDADATSIYGSRGSNGVVIITTKTAKAGMSRFDLNIKQGIDNVSQKARLLNLEDYLALRREAFANDNKIPSADPTSPNYAPDLTIWSQTEETDWIDYFFGNTGKSTDIQTKISGGKDRNTFSVSGNFNNQTTVIPGDNNFLRAGISTQFRHQSDNDKLNISLSNQITYQLNELSNLYKSLSGFTLAPNYPLYLQDGTLNWRTSANPAADMLARSKVKTNNSITSLNLDYKVLSDLHIRLNTGYTKTTYDQVHTFPTRSLAPDKTNYTQFGNNSAQSIIFEPQINYKLKLKNSSISFLAGATFQNRINEIQNIQASNFRIEGLMEDLSSATTIDSRITNYTQYKYGSLFGRFTYNLKDTYILNATIRRDGSSRFGPGNRFGNFGSIGAAWLFSNLSFIKEKIPFLSYGKLRGSYGTTGNDQIGDYQYLSTYSSPGTNIYQDIATVRPSRINNADFHWETTQKIDVGIEVGILKDRIMLTADFYSNQSKDQLVSYRIPQITGFQSYQANLPAVIENSGWEFSGNASILSSKSFNWTTTFNISFPKNRLKSFEGFQTSGYSSTYEMGYDISRIYGYKSLGINESTGKAQYAGQNGEVSTTPYLYFTLGKTSPDYYGGFGNSFRYHNFDLNIFAQFVKQMSVGSLVVNPGITSTNNYQIVNDRWSASNPGSNIPIATTAYDLYFGGSSANIFDTSYLRIKNIQLSYNVPSPYLKKIKIQNLRIYGEGQNLFTFWDSNAAIADPESGTLYSNSNSSRNFPTLKTFVIGLQLTL